ncbi:hypothetical protein LUZ62_005607 [Rhynchospora pubera]|uniref:Ribosomal protein S3 n=1 Tax=Rhynchospora pubera TaxID=906938 RepID=A0AAV8B7U4_9POAL|nr:hypothetical protein LUZ62_005607 [Rhynchospora pubera]
MGQKTNPLCFRLGTTQSHHSIWFEEPKKYATGIQEDQKIRDFFKNYVQYRLNKYYQMVVKEVNQRNTKYENIRIPPLGFEGIVRIKIEKQANKIQKPFIRIKIYSGFVPKFLLKENTLAHFRENIKKQEFYSVYPSPRKITVHLEKAEIHYRQPNLLAEYIALQLKNRVPYRKDNGTSY